MRIELNIYTNKRQKARMRKAKEQLALLLFTPLQKLLPLIETAAGAAILLLFCCMDSENLQAVLSLVLAAGLILAAAFTAHCYIRAELYQIRMERLHAAKRVYPRFI